MQNLTYWWPKSIESFELFTVDHLSKIWNSINDHDRSMFRSQLCQIQEQGIFHISLDLIVLSKTWKARIKQPNLNEVINWDPNSGALTSSELEILRKTISNN